MKQFTKEIGFEVSHEGCRKVGLQNINLISAPKYDGTIGLVIRRSVTK